MTVPYQAPDSAHRGYIQPGSSNDNFSLDVMPGFDQGLWDGPILPLYGQSLTDFLQQLVAGVVGLDGTLVRPRWQQEPPNLPLPTVDWAAIGIVRRRPIGPGVMTVQHDPRGQGRDWMARQEEIDLLCSFYGPRADDNAGALNDGLMIAQNRETLFLSKMALVEAHEAVQAPELINEVWYDRFDVMVTFRRTVLRVYPVLTVVEFLVRINGDPSNAPAGPVINNIDLKFSGY